MDSVPTGRYGQLFTVVPAIIDGFTLEKKYLDFFNRCRILSENILEFLIAFKI